MFVADNMKQVERYFLLCFFFLPLLCFGQSGFEPAKFVVEDQNLSTAFGAAFASQLERYSDMSKAERKTVKEVLEARQEMMTSMLESGSFILESPILTHFEGIFQKILEANPEIDPNTQLLLSRSGLPNAFTTGDGFFVINLGLIVQMKSDDEMAFVIGHELSHQTEDHSYHAIRNYAPLAVDPERNKEIKRILKSEYQVVTKLQNLIIPGMMASMQFSRDNELEADKVGVEYSTKAGYDYVGGIRALRVLDRVDDILYEEELPWAEFYENLTCDVSPVWEEEHTSSLGTFAARNEETIRLLRSHPDCEIRIEKLIESTDALEITDSIAVDSAYMAIRKIARLELVESYVKNNERALALYHALHLYHEDTNLPYISETAANIFGLFYFLKKERAFGTHVEISAPYHANDYKEFLDMIWEMSADECACAAFNLMQKSPGIDRPDENLSARALAHYARGEKEKSLALAEEYLATYPNGRHKYRMNFIINRK